MSANMPLISVVIPAWNEEERIAECLESLEAQTNRDFEVVVVDNGSTDGTVSIARGFGVRVAGEPQRGIACARQTGFEAGRGAIIASTDADCVLPSDWTQQIADAFRFRPEAVAAFGPFRYRAGTAPTRAANLLIPLFSGVLRAGQRIAWWLGKPHFPGSNFAVRREVFLDIDGFRSSSEGGFYGYWEDVQIGKNLHRVGEVLFAPGNCVQASGRKLCSVGQNIVYPARQATVLHLLGRDL